MPTGVDVRTLRSARAGRSSAIAAVITGSGAIALVLSLAAPHRGALIAVLVCAFGWGIAGSAAIAMIPVENPHRGRSRRLNRVSEVPVDTLVIGTLMHLGNVPDELATMTSAAAAVMGPVALLVPPARMVPAGLDPAVTPVDTGRHETQGMLQEFYSSCDAVLVASARALPEPEGCTRAAGMVARGADWVLGATEALNADRFGPAARDALDTGLRHRATTAGLWCWQPDATIVRSSLLLANPLPQGRPFGTWLRERAADGSYGATLDAVLTRSVAPVAADNYWPDATARQCANAADLADALIAPHSRFRARAVAAGLLVRALSGWSVLLWLAALVLLADGSPVRRGGSSLIGLAAGSMLLRWLAPRLSANVTPSPASDLLAALYSMPGSLLSARSAATRRIRPPHGGISTRPLAWLALAGTAASATVVLTARPGDAAGRVAAGAAVLLLLLTWVYTVRSLIERSWRRVGFRVPLDLPVSVPSETGHVPPDEWHLVDGGPGGFSFVGPDGGHRPGTEVTVHVAHATDEGLTLHGTVAGIRNYDHRGTVVGVALRAVEPSAATWSTLLVDAAMAMRPVDGAPPGPPMEDVRSTARKHRMERLATALVLGVSVLVVVTIGLALVGIQPLVIRSSSMVPTYSVGDVVLVARENAADIRKGQVVTRFDAPEAMDSLTHRVRHVTHADDSVEVETRGDANRSSELWSVPRTQIVGVVVASVPAIGLPLTAARGSTIWTVILGAVFLGAVAVILLPSRREQVPGISSAQSPQVDRPTADSVSD